MAHNRVPKQFYPDLSQFEREYVGSLRRRRDFLKERINRHEEQYDLAEHAALCWVLKLVDKHYLREE